MKTTRGPEQTCLNCKTTIDSTTDPNGEAQPSPGDFTVCLSCGHLMVFDENLRFRALTDDEMLEIGGNKELLKVQAFSAAFRQWNKRQEKE